MDILTPRGQQTLEDEMQAAKLWESFNPKYKYISTPKDEAAYIDAVITDGWQMIAAVETKCRYDMDLDKFDRERGGEWLITYDKLNNASQLAADLGLPLYGFLYIVPDKILLTTKLANADGELCCRYRIEDTNTQQTVNGGMIRRRNAFIHMSDAKIYK